MMVMSDGGDRWLVFIQKVAENTIYDAALKQTFLTLRNVTPFQQYAVLIHG